MSKIEYSRVGDYYIPNLKIKSRSKVSLGKYGRMRLNYLKEQERAHHNALLMNNKLYDHLIEIDKQAYEMHDRLVEQYKEKRGITEELKQTNQMEWLDR
ncbi:TnpV protein [Thomasclavelia cocleata]|uniref:TnpV protein n=1 Tax=Thomasclavelia cocleata TaxID=69824 RepID=UPI000C26E75A|nr:TnpV protein [Thomasclavelia cocleata]PJN80948.1 TnpV protein [Thomasclavelia cocleata]